MSTEFTNSLSLILFFGIPAVVLWFSYHYLQDKNAELIESKKIPLWRKMLTVASAPLHFLHFQKLFSKEQDTAKENFLFRWYMWFTRFCSRIPFFHFLPKFLVALGAESLVLMITDQRVLAAVLVLWSFTFFLLIYWVESGKKMDEDLITHANKLFLWTVSVVALFLILMYVFMWDIAKPYFDSGFLRAIGSLAHRINDGIVVGIAWFFFDSPAWVKITFFILFALFIISNYRISKIEETQRKKAKEAKDKESETTRMWNEFLKQQTQNSEK